MKDTDRGGDTYWQYSWDCKGKPAAPDTSVSNSMEAAGLAVQDEMASWLHVDDLTYSSQLFGESAGPSNMNMFRVPYTRPQYTCPAYTQSADAALELAARRASGVYLQTGAEVFDKPRTVCQPPSGTMQGAPPVNPQLQVGINSFPHFSVSVARRKCGEDSPDSNKLKSIQPHCLESDRSTVDSKGNNPASDSGVENSKPIDGSRTEKDLKRKEKEVEDTAACLDESKPKPKRSRAAEVHNLSERKRRDRINERMKALQELIPNSNKTDKASMLDEAIEYLKMLQHQLQMMSMRSGMMSPITAMPCMPLMTTSYGMGMGVRLVDVAGRHALLPPRPGLYTGVPSTTCLPQGMNADTYNTGMHQQPQEPKLEED